MEWLKAWLTNPLAVVALAVVLIALVALAAIGLAVVVLAPEVALEGAQRVGLDPRPLSSGLSRLAALLGRITSPSG